MMNCISEIIFKQIQAIAKEYERLKLDLWKQYEHDRNMYTSHKGDFVKQYTQKGKLLFTGRYDNK